MSSRFSQKHYFIGLDLPTDISGNVEQSTSESAVYEWVGAVCTYRAGLSCKVLNERL